MGSEVDTVATDEAVAVSELHELSMHFSDTASVERLVANGSGYGCCAVGQGSFKSQNVINAKRVPDHPHSVEAIPPSFHVYQFKSRPQRPKLAS